jgi:membrane associated rhomboid family serine protease
MSYYTGSEDDQGDAIFSKQESSRGQSNSKRSKQLHDNEPDWADEDDVVDREKSSKRGGGYFSKKQERRSKSRERRKKEKQAKEEMEQSVYFTKKKRAKANKKRQEAVYDDLYGSDYHSVNDVNDGIVGCADDLCVNKHDYMDDDSHNFVKTASSINNGKANKPLDDTEEVYIVRQRYGYFSIFFGIIQCAVLGVMMWQCGIAPMNINPMFGPYPDALSEWGGKNSILIIEDGEWWRLMTPILLHAGLIHLFCNVAVQLELGVFFEREWGSMTWLIIYLTSALGSSVLSVITMPDAVSVGSSGAVMGLFGGKLAEIICRCCEKTDTAQDKVGHQVRKEQCVGVSCSVIVVMAFSFIPYGKLVALSLQKLNSKVSK